MSQETESVVSESANEKLVGLLDYLQNTAKNAESFAVEQLPLVAQEVLTFYFWLSLLGAIVCLLALVGIHYACSLWRTRERESRFPTMEAPYGVQIAASFLPLIGLLVSAFTLLQITLAPRLFLIEYVASQLSR